MDKRDQLIMQFSYSDDNVAGTCSDMCPERERLYRRCINNVSEYEGIAMIKSFPLNPQDPQLAHNIRPEPVLRVTMEYICQHILDLDDNQRSAEDICKWFRFLNDRLCAIRMDIADQNLCTPGSIALLEKCVRFHIHCISRLILREPHIIQLQEVNIENLIHAADSLMAMYDNFTSKEPLTNCPNESKFRAFVILLKANVQKSLTNILHKCSTEVKTSKIIGYALRVHMCIQTQDFGKFGLLLFDDTLNESSSYMLACLLSMYFRQMRQRLTWSLKEQLEYVQRRKTAPLSEIVNGMKLSEVAARVNIYSDFDDDG